MPSLAIAFVDVMSMQRIGFRRSSRLGTPLAFDCVEQRSDQQRACAPILAHIHTHARTHGRAHTATCTLTPTHPSTHTHTLAHPPTHSCSKRYQHPSLTPLRRSAARQVCVWGRRCPHQKYAHALVARKKEIGQASARHLCSEAAGVIVPSCEHTLPVCSANSFDAAQA